LKKKRGPVRKTAPAITLAEAVAAYRADETARCLSKSTTNQSKTLFQFHLLAWAKDVGFSLLRELTTSNLVKFRATWGNGPNTTRRKHERLIGFFEFCIANDWLDKNPALKMKKAEEKRVPTDYFTREEFQRIVDATYAYGDWRGAATFTTAPKMRALILLMRWSGLAIRDAVALERDKLSGDGKLFLYRAKTGVPVRVPLPSELVKLLRSLPTRIRPISSGVATATLKPLRRDGSARFAGYSSERRSRNPTARRSVVTLICSATRSPWNCCSQEFRLTRCPFYWDTAA
jgi:site-specific recombinase XerD